MVRGKERNNIATKLQGLRRSLWFICETWHRGNNDPKGFRIFLGTSAKSASRSG